VEHSQERVYTLHSISWYEFVAKIQERFYPDELRWQKQEESLTLIQGKTIVQAYPDKFAELSRFATSVVPSEEERVKRYVKKLDTRIRVLMTSSGAKPLRQAYEVALDLQASVCPRRSQAPSSSSFRHRLSLQ